MKYTKRDIVDEPSREILVSNTTQMRQKENLFKMLPERKHNYFFLKASDTKWQVVMLTSAGIIRGIDIPDDARYFGSIGALLFVNMLMEQYEAIPYNKENGIRSYYSPCALTAQDVLKIQDANEPINWYKLQDGNLIEVDELVFLGLLSEEQRKHYYEKRLRDFQNQLYRTSDADGSEVIAVAAQVLWYFTKEGQREYYACGIDALNDFVEAVRASDEYSRPDDTVGVRIDGVCIDLLKYVDGQYCLVTDFLSKEKFRYNHNISSFVSSLFHFDMIDSVMVDKWASDGGSVVTMPANEWDNIYNVKGIPGYDDDGFFSSIYDVFDAYKFEHYYMFHCRNHITGYVVVYDENYRVVLECETYLRSTLEKAIKESGLGSILTECPEKMNPVDLAERIRQSACRKHGCPVVPAEISTDLPKEEELLDFEEILTAGSNKIVVFEVIEDIIEPDFCGGDSLEYCIENDLFHKAYSKGELVYCSLNYVFESFNARTVDALKKLLGNPSAYQSMRAYSKEKLEVMYNSILEDCKSAKKRKTLSDEMTLHDVWDVIRHRGFSSPYSKSVSFRGVIDGKVLFKDFISK